MPLKRCFYYDDKGIPRQEKGCPKKRNCKFVHPRDPDWVSAEPSHPPVFLRHNRTPPRRRDSRSRSRSRHRDSSRMEVDIPPPEPHKAPLPPPPKAPTILSNTTDMEEKKELWSKRTRLMSEYMKAEEEESKLIDQIQVIERTMASSLLPLKQSWWDERLAELKDLKEEATKHKEMTFEQLKQVDALPESELGEITQPSELADLLQQLNKVLTEIHQDADTDTSRPHKRPRQETLVTDDELDKLQDLATALDSRISEFDNTLTAHENDFYAGLMQDMDDKFEQTLSDSFQDMPFFRDLEALEKRVAKIEKELLEATLTDESATLMEFKEPQDLSVIRDKLVKLEQVREEDLRQIAALEASIDLYRKTKSKAVTPPERYLMATLEQPLTQAVRSNIRTNIEELRVHLQALLTTRDTELYGTLWENIGNTHRVIEAIRARLEGRMTS